MRRRSLSVLAAAALVLSITGTAAAGNPWEPATLGAQGAGAGAAPSVGTAAVHRTADGVSAHISMTLPAEYNIPDAGPTSTSTGMHGNPEAFSLWVFIFFNPGACDGPCDGTDLQTNLAVVAGGYNGGGRLGGGTSLTIAGHVNQSSATFGGLNAESFADGLSQFDLDDAEIHLAVAPHGVLDPALLPRQISTPAGNASFWWVAAFPPG